MAEKPRLSLLPGTATGKDVAEALRATGAVIVEDLLAEGDL